VAVHVVLGQAGVVERALGHLGVELGEGRVVGFACGVFVGSRDVGRAVGRDRGQTLRPAATLVKFPHSPPWGTRPGSGARATSSTFCPASSARSCSSERWAAKARKLSPSRRSAR